MANQAGLDQLDARRKRAERQIPKPHHAKAPVTIVEPPGAAVENAALTPPAAPDTPVAPPVASAPAPVTKTATAPAPQPAGAPQRKPRSRQTQVLLDARADAHLSELKKRGVMAEVDLSASAILRRALEEYVEAHGYDGIVAWFAEHGRQ